MPIRSLLPAVTFAVLVAGCAATTTKPRTDADPVAERTRLAQPACAASTIAAQPRYAAEPYDSGLPAAGQWRDRFDVADMNGDGIADIVHGPARKSRGTPAIFLGDGAGHFSLWKDAHFPALPYDYGAIVAADFNRDGRADVALAAHLRGFATLVADGGGQFAPWGEGLALYAPTQTVDTPIFTSRNLAAVDWNGDGATDLVALNEGPSRFVAGTLREAFAIWLNRNGGWERVRPENALDTYGDALAIGDIDGDGRPDALIGTQVPGMRMTLLMNDGRAYRPAELRSVPLAATVSAVALHDFDGDGRAEPVDASLAVAGGRWCASLQHVSIPARGGERHTVLFGDASRDPFVAIAVGDVAGSGRGGDVVAVRASGGALVFRRERDRFVRDVDIAPPERYAHCHAFDAKLVPVRGGARLVVSYAGDDDGSGGPQCAGGGGFAAWTLAPKDVP
jgi:hypothetical protein